MNNRKWLKLVIALLIASVIIIGATQKFGTIIAKRIITTSSSGIQLNGGGALSLASGSMTLASGDLTLTTGDTTLTAGDLAIIAGNLSIGDGIPSFTQDGEDAYIEGTLEAAGDVILTAQTTFSVVQGLPITPTGAYMPLTSSPISPDTASEIAAATTIGELLILHNINATRPITVDGTGGLVECKADVALFPQDTLTLLWNGTDWVCLSNYDNS